jgi:hypothetical protein
MKKADIGISAFIILIHYTLSFVGLHTFSLDGYSQLVQEMFPKGLPFWEMLYHFHGNPPLLSILHHWAEVLFSKKSYLFFDLLLPVLHAASFLFFRVALNNSRLKFHILWIGFLFCNPLIFIYFRYPFYCTFLFFLNSALVFFLTRLRDKPGSVIGIVSIFSAECLLRASYFPFLFLILSIWLLPRYSIKNIAIAFIIMLPPILWQFKNQILVGKFTSSTWIGMNLARCHMPWQIHNDLVAFLPPFSKPNEYFELLSDDPKIGLARQEQNYFLSQNNLNHIAIPRISDLYLESMRKEFSFTWSLNTFLNGFLVVFKSPANYEHMQNHLSMAGYWSSSPINPDFFEPIGYNDHQFWYQFFESSDWDPEFERRKAFARITFYTLFYPFLLIWFGFKIRTLSKEEKVIYFLTCLFTLLYALTDIFEANRMRMEYEVFFYFLAFRLFSTVRKLKPKMNGFSYNCLDGSSR